MTKPPLPTMKRSDDDEQPEQAPEPTAERVAEAKPIPNPLGLLGQKIAERKGSTLTVDTAGIVDLMADQMLQQVVEVDAILRHIVEHQDGIADPAQCAYFQRLGWEVRGYGGVGKRALRREIARMRRVLRAQSIAGTKAEREALAADVQRAEA